MLIHARSISLRAAGILRPGVKGRVLASFARVSDLVTEDGAVVALVGADIGDGPLNIVLARAPGAALPAGARCAGQHCDETHRGGPHPGDRAAVAAPLLLAFDAADAPTVALRDARRLLIDLSTAASWDPRPAWDTLRLRRQHIVTGAVVSRDKLTTALARHAPALDAVLRGGQAVAKAYRAGDPEVLATTISALCGLGPGLTPAGDDWLAGWLLGLHLAPDLAGLRNLSGLVTETAAARTTTLSRALLECAAAGEADAAWHTLLAALAGEAAPPRICAATATILAHGATSGAAMLAGFLAGLNIPMD